MSEAPTLATLLGRLSLKIMLLDEVLERAENAGKLDDARAAASEARDKLSDIIKAAEAANEAAQRATSPG
jgi:hypothetical protein